MTWTWGQVLRTRQLSRIRYVERAIFGNWSIIVIPLLLGSLPRLWVSTQGSTRRRSPASSTPSSRPIRAGKNDAEVSQLLRLGGRHTRHWHTWRRTCGACSYRESLTFNPPERCRESLWSRAREIARTQPRQGDNRVHSAKPIDRRIPSSSLQYVFLCGQRHGKVKMASTPTRAPLE